jgi:hypothetical protein
MRLTGIARVGAALAVMAAGAGTALAGDDGGARTRLLGRAVLPAMTVAPGPVSGTQIGAGPFNGVVPPCAGQPVQGISAVLDAGRGSYWAMPDNGCGAKENSGDFPSSTRGRFNVAPTWPSG